MAFLKTFWCHVTQKVPTLISVPIPGEAEVESVSSEQSSHDAERSREASSVGESDSASPGPDHAPVKTHLPAGKVCVVKPEPYTGY